MPQQRHIQLATSATDSSTSKDFVSFQGLFQALKIEKSRTFKDMWKLWY